MCLLKLFQPLGEAPSPLSFFPNRSVRKARLCTLDAVHLGQPVHQCSCCGSHRSDFRVARVNFTIQWEHRALEAEQAVKHKLSTLISPIPHCSTCFRSSLRHNKSLLYFILFYFIQHTGSIFCMENNNMNTVQSINQPLCSPFLCSMDVRHSGLVTKSSILTNCWSFIWSIINTAFHIHISRPHSSVFWSFKTEIKSYNCVTSTSAL